MANRVARCCELRSVMMRSKGNPKQEIDYQVKMVSSYDAVSQRGA